eukprot:6341216-Karenia_brevis.AAC.1
MSGIPKTLLSEGPKVPWVSVKSGLPAFSGILRQLKRMKWIKRIRCHLSRFGTSPTHTGGQDD